MNKCKKGINRIRIVKCISPEVLKNDKYCVACPDNDYCCTFNPELAMLVEKSNVSGDVCKFSQEDISFIQAKYPQVFKFESILEENVWPTAMKFSLIDTYYNTDVMPKILNPIIIDRLENDVYSDDEIEALYEWATKKYDFLTGF